MSYRNEVTKGISTMFLEVDEETLVNVSAIKYITYSMTYDKYQIVFRDDDFINVSAERFNEIKQILLGVCSDGLPQNV